MHDLENFWIAFSSPFIEERLYFYEEFCLYEIRNLFSSPFIEERLYLDKLEKFMSESEWFSSPFIEERLYLMLEKFILMNRVLSSRPLLSRSGCIWTIMTEQIETIEEFSSPFIEERLYLSH